MGSPCNFPFYLHPCVAQLISFCKENDCKMFAVLYQFCCASMLNFAKRLAGAYS